MIAETKICLSCNRGLNGRTDKKFCNDYCRNTHHNQLNCDSNNYIRNTNHILRKNRRILESLLQPPKQIAKISKQTLQSKGFSFQHFTNIYLNKKGTQSHFCYEYGYHMLGEEQVLVIKKKARGKKNVEY